MIDSVKTRFQTIMAVVTSDYHDEYTLKDDQTIARLGNLCLILLILIMTIINLNHTNDPRVAIIAGIALIFFLVAWLDSVFYYNDTFISLMQFFGFIIVFTYFLVEGSIDGAAIYWMLILPFAYMSMLSLRRGIVIGLYFLLLTTACFWTPISKLLPFEYPDTVTSRFPIMYLVSFILALIIGYINKRNILLRAQNKMSLEEAVKNEKKRVERLSLESITSMTSALDARDEYTHRHSEHVAFYSREIGKEYGLDEDTLFELYTTARLHDIGKIGVRDNILNKKSGLTDDEYTIMKGHVEYGAKILSAFDTIQGLDVGALYHHERYDGTGYPHQLKGNQIPLFARIIAVSDALDAMYTTRVYREKAEVSTVKEELLAGRGTQFDPQFVDIAVRLINEGLLERMEAEFLE